MTDTSPTAARPALQSSECSGNYSLVTVHTNTNANNYGIAYPKCNATQFQIVIYKYNNGSQTSWQATGDNIGSSNRTSSPSSPTSSVMCSTLDTQTMPAAISG